MQSTNHHVCVRLAEQKDQEQWDAYVLNHPDASAYHFFAWKLTVEHSYGHSCPYLCAEANGSLVGILPLVHIRLPGVVNELTALPYCDVGGCLCDNGMVQDALLREALEIQQKLNSQKLHLRGALQATECRDAFFRLEATGKVRMLLELPLSSDELLAGFKSKLRSQIRKAEKNGIAFCWGGLKDLEGIYSVFSRNMHELGSPVHSEGWLKNIIEHYATRVKIGVVRCEGKMVGMGVLLLSGQSVSIPWASTLHDYNHLGPNMLLYWNLLRFSADQGFKIFDFGRSTEGEGTYKFKKQWGATPKPLTWYVNTDALHEDFHPAQPSGKRVLASKIWRTMPLFLANRLGPCLRKYISL